MKDTIIISLTKHDDRQNLSFLHRQQDTKFDNPTYDVTSSTPSSHGPEDNWSSPTLTVDTSATHPAAVNPPGTSPIYATVVKKTSKKQSQQTHNVGNETVMPVTSASSNASTTLPALGETPPIYTTVNKTQRNKKQREQTCKETITPMTREECNDKEGEGGVVGDVVYQVLEGHNVHVSRNALVKPAASNQATNHGEENPTLKY